MEAKLVKQVRELRIAIAVMAIFMSLVLFYGFTQSNPKIQKFEEIDVERINIVEKDGTLKLALFNSAKLTRGIAQREGQGTISGMLFYNEEGHEAGGLVYDGKKIEGGQRSEAGLLFDQYRQDQTIALVHEEYKDSLKASYLDGLKIMSRPDRSVVRDEYAFYKFLNTFEGTPEAKDSLIRKQADENKYAAKRLFVGNQRGLEDGTYYDQSGIFINDKYGKKAIRIYVDADNKPHLEVYDENDKTKVYEWVLKEKTIQ